MNQAATIVVSVLVATAAAAGVSFALRPVEQPVESSPIAGLQTAIDDLRKKNDVLQQRVELLAKAPAPVAAPAAGERTAAATVSPEQVAAAVEAYLKKRGDVVAGDASGAGGKSAFDIEKDFDGLVGTNYWENSDAWKRAHEAGVMDEVIKQFEDLAKASPNDTKAQMNLANAYLAYLQLDQTKWPLSMKADATFDKVLAIDERHWEARFTKAVSYTFWPDFMGKKNEALTHFETLIEQQESMPAEEHHAETYLFLGNLLDARGDKAKAKEIWKKGALRHPGSTELAKKNGS